MEEEDYRAPQNAATANRAQIMGIGRNPNAISRPSGLMAGTLQSPDQPRVHGVLDNQRAIINDLADGISRLESRLQPVSTPTPEKDPAIPGPQDPGQLSIANRISLNNETLNYLAGKLNRMTHALEI